MAQLIIQDQFRVDLLQGEHDFGTDVIKVALSNTAIGSDDNYGDLTEIANGNGYTTGGPTTTATVSAPTATSGRVAFSDVTVTASGGAIPTWRYGLIYNSVTGAGIARFDAGSGQTLASGDSRTLDFSTSSFQIGT